MKKTIMTIATLTVIVTSCGPSQQESEAAGQEQLLNQQALEKAAADEMANQAALSQQLIDLKVQLTAEESKLSDVQDWKPFRSDDRKEQEVSAQARVVEELKQQITETDNQITK